MSIQSAFPAIKPSLNLDFANTKKLDPRITFTRASTATYYDGVTTAKAEENLLTSSADAASMTGTNFSNWYRFDEGIFIQNLFGAELLVRLASFH